MTQGIGLIKEESASSLTKQNENQSNLSSSCHGIIGPSSSTNLNNSLSSYHTATAGFPQYSAWPNFYYQQIAAASAAAVNQPTPFNVGGTGTSNWSLTAPYYAQCPNFVQTEKKGRQTYARQQTLLLEEKFLQHSYVNKKQREELRQKTGLKDRQIKIWFQNRRMKAKKEKNRPDEQNNDQNILIPANLSVKSSLLSTVNDIGNSLLLQNQQQNSSPSRCNGNSLISQTVKSECNVSPNNLLEDSATSTIASMTLDFNETNQNQLFNSSYNANIGGLVGAIDNDKFKSHPSMAFGVLPNQNSVAAMWNSMNSTVNNFMIPSGINTNSTASLAANMMMDSSFAAAASSWQQMLPQQLPSTISPMFHPVPNTRTNNQFEYNLYPSTNA